MALVSNLVFYFSSCFRIGFLLVVAVTVVVLIHIGFSSASNSS